MNSLFQEVEITIYPGCSIHDEYNTDFILIHGLLQPDILNIGCNKNCWFAAQGRRKAYA